MDNRRIISLVFCLGVLCSYAQNAITTRDYVADLENDAVRGFLNEVVYEPHEKSQIDNYRQSLNGYGYWPKPAVIDIPQITADSLLIVCCDDETLRDSLTFCVSATNHTADLYNLIPNRTYRYQIKTEDNVLQQGRIQTRGQLRMIRVSTIVANVRDLGGWKTTENKQICYNKIIRGTELNGKHPATAEDINILLNLGVSAELDFRASYEQDYNVSAFGFRKSVPTGKVASYFNSNNSGQLPSHLTNSTYLTKWRQEFQFVVNNLRVGRTIYEHCIWGKDRTGYLSFLLEGLLGVPYNELVKDYELSFFYSNGVSTKDSIDKVFDYIETMEGETLRDRFNTFFVRKLGVKQSDIDYFRGEMLEAVKSEDTAIRNISTATDDIHDGTLYDLNGRRVTTVRRDGLYLVRGRNGQTRKVFLRQ